MRATVLEAKDRQIPKNTAEATIGEYCKYWGITSCTFLMAMALTGTGFLLPLENSGDWPGILKFFGVAMTIVTYYGLYQIKRSKVTQLKANGDFELVTTIPQPDNLGLLPAAAFHIMFPEDRSH